MTAGNMLFTTRITLTEFETFIAQPENASRLFELINQEIVEKMPGRTRYSEIALIIATAVRMFCLEHRLAYHISGADGAYRIGEHVLVPDFAFKHTPMSDAYPDPQPPLWVVEVISPTDKAQDIRAKRKIYKAANILLWEVYVEDQTIDVYPVGGAERTEFSIETVLNVGDILPDFTLAVQMLFA